ncbi:unconventional myosin-IXa-like isoform X3 [Xenia sp. Carnegie-2017]|uniref:unconventional myosin-IXa-like isoform X3 n=1 Tax=Xenia sp. Carnegie-2017 TaxID=2897299 RepID=UPI001F04DED7|nr:unconventional myosin-IXa-like isoform X3 [Xenia sp. Carnegie-2017]
MSNAGVFVSLRIFPGHIAPGLQSIELKVSEYVTTRKVLKLVLVELEIQEPPEKYELVEVCVHNDQSARGTPSLPDEESEEDEEKIVVSETSERVLSFSDNPVKVTQSWRRMGAIGNAFRLFLRERQGARNIVNRLTYGWMDCHESVRGGGFQFDVYANVDDDDLCRLPDLNENSLLEKLFERFERGKIYTYVGEILIAVNPYKFFPIYNPKYINAYQNKRLGEMQPHIFAIADEAFQNMLKEKRNQCVVISGESGSGKTESTKLLLHHLTALSHKSGLENTSVEKTILGAGPVLEAFGNAKTSSNNNSSRFGKFTEVKFREDGTVSGAILRKYLLEKSRIVTQATGERNYHVFYYLLAGANEVEAQEFHLRNPEEFCYLNQSGCFDMDGVDEAYEFLRLKQSMDMVGFSSDTQRKIFRVLSAVLWMGNVEFVRKHGFDDAVTLKDKDDDGVVSIISNLLMLKKEKFVSVLTSRKKKARTEQIVMSYKLEEAVDTRDALAKALYGALFDWIVLQVNHTLAMKYTEKHDLKGNAIGVLDIFGFEVFEQNGFEQFCINYANEKLQFYFNHHIFRMEQDEYKQEGIDWSDVYYVDNSSCLDLIHGKPTGLFQLLDEESGLSGNVASDTTLLAKFENHHESHDCFERSRMGPTFTIVHYAGKVTYEIKDFRAKNKDLMRPEIVSILKNSQMRFIRELLGADPLAIYRWAIVRNYFRAAAAFKKFGKKHKQDNRNRRSRFISESKEPPRIVEESTVIDEQYMDDRAKMLRKASKMVRKRMKSINTPDQVLNCLSMDLVRRGMKSGSSQILTSYKDIERIRKGLENKKDMTIKTFDYLYRGSAKRKASLKNPPTVTAQFQLSLNRLMEILDESNPFFVRCIRSNAEKAPLEFTKDLVLSQLRYTGMLETIRIRKLGYHIRYAYSDFYLIFGLLLPREMKCEQLKDGLREVFDKLELHPDHYRLGETKVFFRESVHDKLRTKIDDEFLRRVSLLQSWFRALHHRKQFLQKREAVRIIQVRYRQHLELRGKAAIKIQAAWRIHVALMEHRRKKIEEENRSFRFGRSKSPRVSPRGYSSLKLPLDSRSRSKSPKMERLRKTLSLQLSRHTSPKDVGETKKHGIRPRSLTLSPKSPITKHASLTSVQEFDRESSGKQSSDLASEICRHFPELTDEMRSVGDVESPIDESNSARTSQSSAKISEVSTPEDKLETEVETLLINGEENDGGHLDNTESTVFHITDDNSPADRNVPVPRMTRKRAGSFKNLRKRLSGVQRRSTIGIGEKTSDEPEEIPVEPKQTEEDLNKEKFLKTPRKRGLFSKRKVKEKDKAMRKGSETSQSNERPDNKLIKKHSNDQLSQALDSPRGVRQLKGDSSVVLEGSDGLDEIDKFLTDKQNDTLSITSEDLSRRFESILTNIIKVNKFHSEFPLRMVINAFEGLLCEFKDSSSQHAAKVHKNKRKPISKNKKKKHNSIKEHNGHRYALTTFNIHTTCEHCGNQIRLLEKGFVCIDCKFTVHKRCYKKSTRPCQNKYERTKSIASGSLFGKELNFLVSDDIQIPVVVVRLINEVENKGTFQEGIYRKSPSAAKVRQLKNCFSAVEDVNEVDLSVYAIHVVAAVLKMFFRTLSSPLITPEVYEEFLRACDLSDHESRLKRFLTLVDTLPKPNQDTLERLVVHLASIAKYESSNLMSPSGLSVIWAPCLMRPREGGSALDGLYDIRKQSLIVETLIIGQMSKIDATFADITKIDQSLKNITSKLKRLGSDKGNEEEAAAGEEQQKKSLTDQIEKLENQKALLKANLSTLTPHSSLVFEEDNTTDSENGTSDEIDGEKKDTEEISLSEVFLESGTSEQVSSPPVGDKKETTKRRASSLTKRYMNSDSEDSPDSVT